MKDHYQTLGLKRDATSDQIRLAFRALSKKFHPDQNPGDEFERKFKEISEAYTVLSDDRSKSKYDTLNGMSFEFRQRPAHRRSPFASNFQSNDFQDLFQDLFKNIDPNTGRTNHRNPPRRRSRPRIELDVEVGVVVSLEEALHGCKKSVKIHNLNPVAACMDCGATGREIGGKRMICSACDGHGKKMDSSSFTMNVETCHACNGSGSISIVPCKKCNGMGHLPFSKNVTVSIPAGISGGQKLRLAEQGIPGMERFGDLYVTVQVMDDQKFVREDNDLITDYEVSISDMFNGTVGTIELPDGEKVSFQIPSGVRPGDALTINNKGATDVRNGKRGALLVGIKLSLPSRVSARAIKLMEELELEFGKTKSN